MAEKEKKKGTKSHFLKNCIVLLVITLISGAALAVVNQVTKEPIARAETAAKLESYASVFPQADSFKAVPGSADILKSANRDIPKAGFADAEGCTVDDLESAFDKNGNIIGYVMSATSPNGYGGDIQIAVGISLKTGKITGFDVLSHSETPGLGAKSTEDEYKNQFRGKSAKGITYSKTGAKDDTEIDAISGATITTKATTAAVNSALLVYNNYLLTGSDNSSINTREGK